MNEATRMYDLNVIKTTPWARGDIGTSRRLPRVSWRPLASALCLWTGVLAFAVAMVALRLSLYVQSVISSRAAVITTLVLGVVGVLLFFGAHSLHGESGDTAGPDAR